jgi:hypothetical protein
VANSKDTDLRSCSDCRKSWAKASFVEVAIAASLTSVYVVKGN